MIKATSLYKSFGKLQVLKGVDLEIKKGEIVSVVGTSGAGKTTLLHLLGTLEQPDRHQDTSLIINEVDVLKLNPKELSHFRNNHLGFIFQFHQLLPEFTAVENVCIPAFIKGTGQTAALKRAQELLDYLGLKDRFNHKPAALSGGEQQRVAVARALMNEPEIILADEPTGNLDSNTAQQFHELIKKLRVEFDQTFVMVTHNKELADLADRKLVMQDGQFL
jgi:lipoprotein-releasing system ATP-binding protein